MPSFQSAKLRLSHRIIKRDFCLLWINLNSDYINPSLILGRRLSSLYDWLSHEQVVNNVNNSKISLFGLDTWSNENISETSSVAN